MAPFGLPLGALGRPSWLKISLGRSLFQKNVIFQKRSATRGRVHSVTSRGHRKRPKIAPRRPQDGLKEVLFRCSISSSILVRFGSRFGAILGPQDGHFGGRFLLFFGMSPQGRPKRRQEAPKGGPRGSKRRPGRPQEAPGRPPAAPEPIQPKRPADKFFKFFEKTVFKDFLCFFYYFTNFDDFYIFHFLHFFVNFYFWGAAA